MMILRPTGLKAKSQVGRGHLVDRRQRLTTEIFTGRVLDMRETFHSKEEDEDDH